MATLKTNTLTGTTTAGSIAVTGEGNSTTTNLQQGLLKCWIKADMNTENTTQDSFNTASISDEGTGGYHWNVTNAFSSTNAIYVGITARTATSKVSGTLGATMNSASQFDVNTVQNGGAAGATDTADAEVDLMGAGDLA